MKSREPHYVNTIDVVRSLPDSEKVLGLNVAWTYYDDPKRLSFTLSRYKFASKMLDGSHKCLEVGCGDGFATRLLRQHIPCVVGVDVDDDFIADAQNRLSDKWNINFLHHDFLSEGPLKHDFDSVVCLDVIEHINRSNHDLFLQNILSSMSAQSKLVIGCPSLESQEWASPQSKLGHIACMTQSDFSSLLKGHFNYVLMFSMNDEIVHTGYSKMSHYNIAVCCR